MERKIIMNDDAFLCNICLALTTNLLAHKLQNHVLKGFSKRNIWEIFEVSNLLAGNFY